MSNGPVRRDRVLLGAALAVAIVGLVVHSRRFDFVCDDAFLALRQAQNLAAHGAPVYNMGERVEAATSPAWVALLALGLLLHVPPVALLQGLGIASGVLLVIATFALAIRVVGARPLPVAFALAALVAMAPVAAWSGGGLESPLFAACVTYALAGVARMDANPTRAAASELGTALAFGCLVRLECLLLVLVALFVLRRVAVAQLARVLAIVLVPLALLTIFRLGYYGLPLPHTFYAKTAGVGTARIGQGLAYASFALSDMGLLEMVVLCTSPFLVRPSAFVSTVRLFFPLYVGYIVSVGGDFLDLYRFFVPIFPGLVVCMVALGLELFERNALPPMLRLLAGAMVLVPLGIRQHRLGTRALAHADASRAAVGVEPLGWTKAAARDWAATGRWLASVAEPGDTLATSASGAIPFFSRLSNYDLFGLAAPDVARYGRPFWNRAGHTRAATPEQIQRRAPTFLLHGDGEGWEGEHYEKVLIRVPDGPTQTFFVRRPRATVLLQRADVERFVK